MGRSLNGKKARLLIWKNSFGILSVLGGIALASTFMNGCVSSEKYEAEKARALNFQRLLAQEEKRTGELTNKYQTAQQKQSSLESQNRDLNAEMEALREQLNRTEEELTKLREGTAPKTAATASEDLTLAEPSISELGLEDIGFEDEDFKDVGSQTEAAVNPSLTAKSELSGTEGEGDTATMHTVEKGETLYRISRQYGVSVQDLKDWNNLSNNLISIGQELIVSQP